MTKDKEKKRRKTSRFTGNNREGSRMRMRKGKQNRKENIMCSETE